MRDLRENEAQPDGHHLTAAGLAILSSRLLPEVLRALGR
jgi:hypothetical protein